MSIQVGLTGYIQVTDTISGTVAYQKALSSLLNTGLTSFGETQQGSYGTGGSALTLPASPVYFVYIKNTHGTQNIAITWTPTGGSLVAGPTLGPGAAVIYIATSAVGGFSAITLTGSATATTAEFILAG
jgi:hypothetical protein